MNIAVILYIAALVAANLLLGGAAWSWLLRK